MTGCSIARHDERMPTMSQPPDPEPRKPRLQCPPGACDSHIHLFGPKPRYGLVADAAYDTEDALPESHARLQQVLGLSRAVVVQATVQGHDHDRLLDALREDPARYRGIAVPQPEVSDAELDRMHALGVRGIRVVTRGTGLSGSGDSRSRLDRSLIDRIAARGWHVQVFAQGRELPELRDALLELPCDVVIDHAGLVPADLGPRHPDFEALLEMLDSGRVWVKLSGPIRFSRQRSLPYSDTLPFYRALVDRSPERLVWGSDWPHIHFRGVMPNDGDLLDLLLEWAPEAGLRERILVDNPARLYDFPPA